MRDLTLWIYDSGASTADIERGVEAAVAELTRLGVTAAAAAEADTASADDEAHDTAAAAAWRSAERAALAACFDGWARWPDGAHLAPA